MKSERVGEDEDEVEITIDSGAAKSVWPRKKKGVRRQKIVGRKPKLQAANGTEIAVDGEAVLDFVVGGRQGSMKFLDSDVKKPLGAVSAMEDEGNTVCFSQKWGRFIENDETGERIYFERKNNTYVMKLKVKTEANKGGQKKVRREKKREGMYEKPEEMEVHANDAAEDDEKMARRVENGVEEKVVFRRRMLD